MPPVRTSLANTPSCFSCCTNSDIAAWGGGRGAGRAVLGPCPAPQAELTLRDRRGLGDEASPPRAHLRSGDGHRVLGVVAGRHDTRGAAPLTLFPGQAWGQRQPQKVATGSWHPHSAPPQGEEDVAGVALTTEAVMTAAERHLYEALSPLPCLISGKGVVNATPEAGASFGSVLRPKAPTSDQPQRTLASLSCQSLRFSRVSFRPQPCLPEVRTGPLLPLQPPVSSGSWENHAGLY